MRYRLRTLLIVLALAPPFIAGVVQYRSWCDSQLWRSWETAKVKRDGLLVEWRKAYELFQTGQDSGAQETALRQQYFEARRDVERAVTAIEGRYGSLEEGREQYRQHLISNGRHSWREEPSGTIGETR